MKAKAVKRSAMKQLTVDMYRDCLLSDDINNLSRSSTFYRIESKDHVISTICQTKKSLSHYDDKRYYIDAIHSYAHGHCKIVIPRDPIEKYSLH